MSDRLRFAWFAPYAGNWPSFAMEHTVADALAGAGHEVVMVQCDAILDSYCPVMVARGLTSTSDRGEKARICRDCRQAARIGRQSGRYRTVQLSDLVSAGNIAAAEWQVAAVTPDDWAGLEVDGIPIGRYSAYTTLLHHKTASITTTEAAWAEYRADLRNALIVARAMPALLSEIEPTHAVVYNALYPTNRVFAETMLRRRVPLLNLSAGPSVPRRYATLAVYDGLKASQTSVDSAAFAAAMEVPCTPVEVGLVEEHLRTLMQGDDPWVYSAAASGIAPAAVRERLGLRPDSPVVTVIVSSPDETRSSMLVDAEFMRDPQAGYAPSSEFLEECLTLARRTPGVDFVFRMHPRMAPNKREKVQSPDLEQMDALLVDLPTNVAVNYPGDGLSLYDLVPISSAAVNHTSSAGMEFLVFGIPAIQYDPARAGVYPLSFSFPVDRHDAQAFSGQLRAALDSGWSLDRSIAVFRWQAARQIRSVVHLEPLPTGSVDEAPKGAAATADETPSRLGRLLPSRVKERIALELEGRRRAAALASRALDRQTVTEFLQHAAAARVEGDVWEPPMQLPADADPSTEHAAVSAAVARLSSRLNLVDPTGVGVLAQARF